MTHHRVTGHDHIDQTEVFSEFEKVLRWLGERPTVSALATHSTLVTADPVELGTLNVRRQADMDLAAMRDRQSAQGSRRLVADRGGVWEDEQGGVDTGGQGVGQRRLG